MSCCWGVGLSEVSSELRQQRLFVSTSPRLLAKEWSVALYYNICICLGRVLEGELDHDAQSLPQESRC